MSKKILISFLLILVLALAACGGNATATKAPVQAEPTKAPAKAEPTKAPEQPASGEKVTLTIESWRNDDLKIWHLIFARIERDSIICRKSNANRGGFYSPNEPATYFSKQISRS